MSSKSPAGRLDTLFQARGFALDVQRPQCSGFANGCQCVPCKAKSTSVWGRLSSDKDVRTEIALLRKLGFLFTGRNSAGGLCFEHEDVPFLGPPKEITLPSNPSGGGWRKKHRHRLARYLGLNQHQLERLVAGQPLESVKRNRGPGRKANETVVIEHATSLGIPCDETQARRLIGRFGGTKQARRALSKMAAAQTAAA